MRVRGGGIQFPHTAGTFCRRWVADCYCMLCFDTPFLYEKGGDLMRGEIGQVVVHSPGTPIWHGPLPEADQGFVNDWIYLESDELPQLLSRYPLPLNTAFSVGYPHALRHMIGQMLNETATKQYGSEDKLSCLLTDTVIELYRAYHRSTGTVSALDVTRTHMIGSPEQDWTLDALAKEAGYSVSRFCALYRERFGKPPKQELLEARLEKARDLLRYSGCSVEDIAAACGFRSPGYFSRYFKQSTGLSPRAFARQDMK